MIATYSDLCALMSDRGLISFSSTGESIDIGFVGADILPETGGKYCDAKCEQHGIKSFFLHYEKSTLFFYYFIIIKRIGSIRQISCQDWQLI